MADKRTFTFDDDTTGPDPKRYPDYGAGGKDPWPKYKDYAGGMSAKRPDIEWDAEDDTAETAKL